MAADITPGLNLDPTFAKVRRHKAADARPLARSSRRSRTIEMGMNPGIDRSRAPARGATHLAWGWEAAGGDLFIKPGAAHARAGDNTRQPFKAGAIG